MGNNLLGWQTPRIHYSKYISPLSTIGSTTTGDHRTALLMSLNPLAPAFLPLSQSSSDQPPSLCNPVMSLPLAQLFSGMPPQFTPFPAPAINQHVSDGTFFFPFLQQTSQFQPNAAALQPTSEFSALLSSPLQHQANYLKAIHKTV